MVLEREGFHVKMARDGLEALDVAKRRKPDLVLLDTKAPVMDGRAFAKEFRSRYGRGVPIVVLATEAASDSDLEIGAEFSTLTTLNVFRGRSGVGYDCIQP